MAITRALIAGAILVLPKYPAYAFDSSGGYSSNITVANDGNVLFTYTGGTHTGGLPACADPNGLWIIQLGSVGGGQGLLAARLSASARHQSIAIHGTDTCVGNHGAVAYLVIDGQ